MLFSLKRSLDPYSKPTIFSVTSLEITNEVWSLHLLKVWTTQSTSVFWQYRSSYGVSWGLKPSMILWVYIPVVLSITKRHDLYSVRAGLKWNMGCKTAITRYCYTFSIRICYLVLLSHSFFPLFILNNLGVENKKTIAHMLRENITRLAILSNTSPAEMYTNVNAFMSDSVSKNLNIGDEISSQLNSEHQPIHLLCGAHPAEVIQVIS